MSDATMQTVLAALVGVVLGVGVTTAIFVVDDRPTWTEYHACVSSAHPMVDWRMSPRELDQWENMPDGWVTENIERVNAICEPVRPDVSEDTDFTEPPPNG